MSQQNLSAFEFKQLSLEGQSGLALARNLMTHPDAIGLMQLALFFVLSQRQCGRVFDVFHDKTGRNIR